MAVTYLFTVAVNTLILLSLPLTLRLYSLSDESLALARVLIFIHNGFAMLLWPGRLHAAERPARRRRRAVHNDRIGFFDGGLPHRLSLVLAMQLNYGAIGVFAAMVVDWLFRSVVFFLRYRSGRWWPSRAVT